MTRRIMNVDVARVRHDQARRQARLEGWMSAVRLMAPPIALMAIAFVIAIAMLSSVAR